jgi:hypothetical protein
MPYGQEASSERERRFLAVPARSHCYGTPIDTMLRNRFYSHVKIALGAFGLLLFSLHLVSAATEEPKLLVKLAPLPVGLDPDFQFRKTKLYALTEKDQAVKQKTTKSDTKKGDETSNTTAGSKSTNVTQEASLTFERQYRLFGAVTKLDQHQRFGDYFDFYWRAKRPADLTVRLEYRQEKLHAHVQGQEISYANVHGSHKSEFKVIGDDYFDGGRVIAWRCLLIENGRIVAENRSFLWE